MKVENLPLLVQKDSTSKFANSKSTKKGKVAATNALEACLEIVHYKEGIPLIASIIIESTPPSSARTHSTKRSTMAKSKPPLSRQPSNTLPSSRTHGSKKKTFPPVSFTASKRRVCYLEFLPRLYLSYLMSIYVANYMHASFPSLAV